MMAMGSGEAGGLVAHSHYQQLNLDVRIISQQLSSCAPQLLSFVNSPHKSKMSSTGPRGSARAKRKLIVEGGDASDTNTTSERGQK